MGLEIKERITRACRELAAARGLYSLTVDELAARAGVSKRTLYRYFRSKEEIIETAIHELVVEMSDSVKRTISSEDDPALIINSLVKNVFSRAQVFLTPQVLSDLRQYYPYLWHKIEKFREERMRETFKVMIEKSGKASLGDLNPKIISAVVMASINSVATPQYILDNGLTLEETINQLSKIIARILLGHSP